MKKKIAIVCSDIKSSLFYEHQIKSLFKDTVETVTHSFEAENMKDIYGDLIVVSMYSIYEVVKANTSDSIDIIVADITITKEALNKLKNVSKFKRAMLANISIDIAIETISQINQYGINHFDILPYSPSMDVIPEVDFAITPGEKQLVPPQVKTIVDIGHRVISMSSIADIAIMLGLGHLLQTKDFQDYFNSIHITNVGIHSLIGKTGTLEKSLLLILQVFDEAMLCLNNKNHVLYANAAANELLNIRINSSQEPIKNTAVVKLLNDPLFRNLNRKKSAIKDKLFNIHGKPYVVCIYPVEILGEKKGSIITLKEYNQSEKQLHKLRKQLVSKGHVAKYTFADIIGESKTIKEVISSAKKVGSSNSSVLLTGESGTGKELFAQAIHNSSDRKDYQFVAVNCSAIPDNLLESELFGYEDGAFTGAKKGGKIGYFERAHMGTLFLDEIGEIPLSLQSKLLRVLQEREVVRIGGDRIISVDVRIISATNKNLLELVKHDKFRRDLYYRLNVLPLFIPPLRQRRDDIALLVEHFKHQFNANFKLSPNALEAFENNPWDGNIRELRNIVERLTHIDHDEISASDLRQIFQINTDTFKKIDSETLVPSNQHFIFILTILNRYYTQQKRIGRKAIADIAKSENYFLSEGEIRNHLNDLKNYGFVEIVKGRGGTKITPKGITYLNRYL